MRLCNESNDKKYMIGVMFKLTRMKEIAARLKLLKRQAPNQFGHMFPCYK